MIEFEIPVTIRTIVLFQGVGGRNEGAKKGNQ